MVRRLGSVAGAAARDLMRRRAGLALLVAIPLALYLSVASNDDGGDAYGFGLVAATVGVAWSAGGAAFFLSVAAREPDARLVLAGYRPSELVAGRLLVLELAVSAFALLFCTVIAATMTIEDVPLLLAAAVAAGTVAIPFGLALAAFFPRELEGALSLIGVIGIQMSVSATGDTPRWLPFSGPIEIARAADAGFGPLAVPALLTVAWTAGLFAVALVGWRRGLPRAAPAVGAGA